MNSKKLSHQQHRANDWMSNLMNQWLSEFNSEPNLSSNLWSPAIDIKEEPNQFVVFADLPGVDGDDIHISHENGVLTIKGERKFDRREEKEGFTRVERFEGQFYRRFSLPETANEDLIQAKYKKGVLEISIPKKEEVQAKRIEVKISDE